MKILILVMSHDTNDETFKTFKSIWDKKIQIFENRKISVNVKFLYCSETLKIKDYIVENNNIITNCKEDYWSSLLKKVIYGFEFFEASNFDFVFKTNLSTIINIEKFLKYCEKKLQNRDYVYDGKFASYEDYLFCSGAGMLLNKNSVNLILKNKNLINEKWTDDIFIGYVLNKLNKIEPTYNGLNRYDIIKENTEINKNLIKSYSHIRIKIREKNLDSFYAKKIYNFLYE